VVTRAEARLTHMPTQSRISWREATGPYSKSTSESRGQASMKLLEEVIFGLNLFYTISACANYDSQQQSLRREG